MKPQGGAGTQRPCGSAAADGTGLQVPALPVTLHAWQIPQEEVEQQTPSTQLFPVRHSSVVAQDCPRRFLFPQRLTMRSQMLGDAQLASETQVVLHAVPLQEYGSHDCVLAARQAPAPSQVRASVAVVVATGQEGAAHVVPAA